MSNIGLVIFPFLTSHLSLDFTFWLDTTLKLTRIVRCAKFWLDMRQGCSQLQNLSVQQTCDIITAAEELLDAFHASVCLFLYYD